MNHQVTVEELRAFELNHSLLLALQSNKKKLYWYPGDQYYKLYENKNGTWLISYIYDLKLAVEKYNDIF